MSAGRGEDRNRELDSREPYEPLYDERPFWLADALGYIVGGVLGIGVAGGILALIGWLAQ